MASKREIMADVPPGMRPFTSIKDYIENVRGTDSVHQDASLCRVLAWTSGWLEKTAGTENNPGIPIPWVTLVLGSEVLDSLPPKVPQASFIANLEAKLKSEQTLNKHGFPIAEEANDVAQFAWTLLESRDSMRRPDGRSHGSSDPEGSNSEPVLPDYDDVQLNVIVAAYAVTRAYFFSKLAQHAPINREEDQVFAIAFGFKWSGPLQGADPEEVFWRRAAAALESLKALTEHRPAASDIGLDHPARATRVDQTVMIGQLADLMQNSIKEQASLANVSSGSLLLLTEIAWHYLVDTLRKTQDPNAYHDWSEQLITIDMQPGRGTQPNPSRVQFLNGTEPLGVAYEVASDAIERELINTTELRDAHLAKMGEAIRAGQLDKLSGHDRAYKVYCDLLHAQSAVRRRASDMKTKRKIGDGDPLPDITTDFNILPRQGIASPSRSVPPARLPQSTESAKPTSPDSGETSTEDGSDVLSMEAVPYATAVVTTFDIELELALWHFHQESFMVIIPVNVVHETDTVYKGQQAWVGYVVHPRDGADAVTSITQPPKNSFFLVESGEGESVIAETTSNSDRLGDTNMPIVVKLCGSPLVSLPEFPRELSRLNPEAKLPVFNDLDRAEFPLVSGFWEAKEGVNPKQPKLRHGLVLEDFQAMVAALPEADATAKLTLPANLRGSVSPGYWRYWTLLGVDMTDSALRYRLIGQMLGSTFGTGAPRQQRRTGVAINHERRVNRKARSLMQWRQIEVVHDDALAFRTALDHYVKHLNDEKLLDRKIVCGAADGQPSPIRTSQKDPVSRRTWTFHGDPCDLDKDERHQS
ncbi:MAG: hypothetical protein LBK54_07270 [Propionibacteriaceae bacterium]|jgi:hypothetical protein|nr:hypothetical protein [Propionibacteriaceae bacterium]